MPFDRVLYFVTPPPWLAALAAFDAVVGARLHGAMAGLAAGRPSLLVTTDSRTAELARVMRLPHVGSDAAVAAAHAAGPGGCLELLRRTRGTLLRFDANRLLLAQRLRRAYAGYNVTVSAAFERFARGAGGSGPEEQAALEGRARGRRRAARRARSRRRDG